MFNMKLFVLAVVGWANTAWAQSTFDNCVAVITPATAVSGQPLTQLQFTFDFTLGGTDNFVQNDVIEFTATSASGTSPFTTVVAGPISGGTVCSAQTGLHTTDTCATNAGTLKLTFTKVEATAVSATTSMSLTVVSGALDKFATWPSETLTFTLSGTFTNTITAGTGCTNFAGWTTVQAAFGSVSMTPTTGTTGGTVGDVVITFTPNAAVVAGTNDIEVTNTAGGFTRTTGTSNPTVTLAAGGAAFGTQTMITDTATAFTIRGTTNLVAGTAYKITIPSATTGTFGTAGTSSTITLDSTTGGVAGDFAVNAVGTVASTASGAVSDPITFNHYTGEKVKFWLPHGEYTTILETPHLKVMTLPMQGPTEDLQWMGTFKVVTTDNQPVVEVSAKRGNATAVTSQADVFEQLDVTLFAESAPRVSFETQSFSGGTIQLGVGRQPHHTRTHGKDFFEYVYIQTEQIAFTMVASHAGNEFPNDVALQKEYMHMDLFVMDVAGAKRSEIGGLLPELWGWMNMTKPTKAMLVPPSKQHFCCFEEAKCQSQQA